MNMKVHTVTRVLDFKLKKMQIITAIYDHLGCNIIMPIIPFEIIRWIKKMPRTTNTAVRPAPKLIFTPKDF